MEIKSYSQRFPNGEGYRLDETGWERARYGLLNSKETGQLDPETLGELDQMAAGLDYGEHTLGATGKIASRFYGGTLETDYGKVEWMGQAPEEVREFVEEIEKAVDQSH